MDFTFTQDIEDARELARRIFQDMASQRALREIDQFHFDGIEEALRVLASEFVAFLDGLDSAQPAEQPVHPQAAAQAGAPPAAD